MQPGRPLGANGFGSEQAGAAGGKRVQMLEAVGRKHWQSLLADFLRAEQLSGLAEFTNTREKGGFPDGLAGCWPQGEEALMLRRP